MKNLRQFTLDHLREIGYGIVEEENIPEGGTKAIEDKLKNIWSNIEVSEAEAIAAARFLTEAEMEALDFSQEAIPPELLPAYRKTKMRDYFGEELIEATKFKHKKSARDFTGYAAMALKNTRGEYGQRLEAFYLLSQDLSESVGRDFAAEHRQQKRGHGRFVGDIRWNSRKWKCREWLGQKEFLKPDEWWEPKDFQPMVERAKGQPRHIKDTLGFSVENIPDGQVFGQLMYQVGLSLEKKPVDGQKWKLRKIKDEDWQYAQMFVRHKEAVKAKESIQAEVETVGFTPETLAQVLIETVDSREMYEDILACNDRSLVDAALVLVNQEVRDRINGFYKPKQLTLDDITKKHPQVAKVSEVVLDELSPLVTVDQQIKKISPLCDFGQLSSLDLWTHRLNQAVLMTKETARAVYRLLPHQISDEVWRRLTYKVQSRYFELYSG